MEADILIRDTGIVRRPNKRKDFGKPVLPRRLLSPLWQQMAQASKYSNIKLIDSQMLCVCVISLITFTQNSKTKTSKQQTNLKASYRYRYYKQQQAAKRG